MSSTDSHAPTGSAGCAGCPCRGTCDGARRRAARRRRRWTLAAVLLLAGGAALWAFGCALPDYAAMNDPEFYAAKCGRCHEPWPETRFDDAGWANAVAAHRGDAMLTGAQEERLLAYLRRANDPVPPATGQQEPRASATEPSRR